MARNYTQVLEDLCKNQSVQIAQLVSANEELNEQLLKQNDIITRYLVDHGPSASGGQSFNPIQEVEARIKAEA
jgi:hypothetical protein